MPATAPTLHASDVNHATANDAFNALVDAARADVAASRATGQRFYFPPLVSRMVAGTPRQFPTRHALAIAGAKSTATLNYYTAKD